MTKLTFGLPMSMATIRRKIEAWEELFGSKPQLSLHGEVCDETGSPMWLKGNPVIRIGDHYLAIEDGGYTYLANPIRLHGKLRASITFTNEKE